MNTTAEISCKGYGLHETPCSYVTLLHCMFPFLLVINVRKEQKKNNVIFNIVVLALVRG